MYQYSECDVELFYAEKPLDSHIKSLIEELYDSRSLDREAIAHSLTWLCYEIYPENGESFKARDITLEYDNYVWRQFSYWLDCIDEATGDLDYHKLLMGCTKKEEPELVEFSDIFSATDAILQQLTTIFPLNENVLGGALKFLALRYGVKQDESIYTKSNVRRK